MQRPFRDVANAVFHLSVVREHLKNKTPVVELHRNHGIPLSAVKKWIQAYRQGGTNAVIRDANEVQHTLEKPLSAAKRRAIEAGLRSDDSDEKCTAIIYVALYGLREYVPELMLCLGSPASIDVILTLKTLGATAELAIAKARLGRQYKAWF
jgi:transposase-like protein